MLWWLHWLLLGAGAATWSPDEFILVLEWLTVTVLLNKVTLKFFTQSEVKGMLDFFFFLLDSSFSHCYSGKDQSILSLKYQLQCTLVQRAFFDLVERNNGMTSSICDHSFLLFMCKFFFIQKKHFSAFHIRPVAYFICDFPNPLHLLPSCAAELQLLLLFLIDLSLGHWQQAAFHHELAPPVYCQHIYSKLTGYGAAN